MIKKIIVLISLTFWIWFSYFSFAINFNDASEATSKISSVSIEKKTWTINTQAKSITYNIFKWFKIAIWWLLVAYLIYAWIIMIFSMWDDEKKLSSAKKWLWYPIVWLLFINIPWTLYESFSNKNTVDDVTSNYWDVNVIYERNIFMNSSYFWTTIWWILTFLEIALISFSIIIFTYNWIKVILSWWDEKVLWEAKNKILWSLGGLIFIWIMEVWRNFVFIWDFKWAWKNMFSDLANLALFFAWPVAIFFLSLAWYYYITSAWDEEKVKKAKSIIINTVIWTILLIWMYSFLLDLKTLNF